MTKTLQARMTNVESDHRDKARRSVKNDGNAKQFGNAGTFSDGRAEGKLGWDSSKPCLEGSSLMLHVQGLPQGFTGSVQMMSAMYFS